MSAQDEAPSALTIRSTIPLSSGFAIPAIGLGVGRNDDLQPACLAAFAQGYRLIDSARMYGNEEQVGKAVRSSGVPRSEVFLTSKVDQLDGGYEGVLEEVDNALKNFGTDYLDLFLIHSPLPGKEKRLAAWKALLAAKDAGKLRSVGVSNYGIKHLEEIQAAGLETPSVNQIELHPLCQQRDIVDWCRKHGVVVEAYAPLIRSDFSNPALQEISKKHERDPAQVLVRWSLQRGFVVLPKSANPERVRSNAAVYDFQLSKEDMEKLDAQDRGREGSITWNPTNAE